MGRPKRAAPGGWEYHVLNRANARMPIFIKDHDFIAFEAVLLEAVERTGTRLLSYCLMPNHWHMVVWSQGDDELSRFAGWLTLTHSQQRHAYRKAEIARVTSSNCSAQPNTNAPAS
jgi:putative transposase